MALKRVWIPSPNYSSRGGAGVRLIVIHTAEGARTIESLGSYFQGPVQASSHTGADDKANTVGEYVRRPDKAWTCAEFNPVSLNIELCGFAAWDLAEWHRHPNMLANCAAWIAEEAAHYGIPITKLSSSEAQGSGRGVCGHVDLGSRGGGHHDPGAQFPWTEVLDMARGGGPAPPTAKVGDMVASCKSAGGTSHTFWVGSNRHQVFVKWQENGVWKGGGLFTEAHENITGLAASLTDDDYLTLFARCDDGSVVYTWQGPGSTDWHGQGKHTAAFTAFN